MKFPIPYPSCNISEIELGTATSQSWVCAAFPDRGWPEPRWWFLYISQFNRDSSIYPYMEALVLTMVCIVGIPTNILALFNFKKRRVKPTFLLLCSALAVFNILMCILGVMVAVARLVVDWPWTIVGCIGFYYGSIVAISMSLWIMALISIERRSCVLSRGDRRRQLSLRSVVIALILMFIFDLVIYGVPYVGLQVADIVRVHVPHAKQGSDNDMVDVCGLFNYRFEIQGEHRPYYIPGTAIQASFILLTTLIIPIPIIIYCHWYCVFFSNFLIFFC